VRERLGRHDRRAARRATSVKSASVAASAYAGCVQRLQVQPDEVRAERVMAPLITA
jgi:hypothetical protein